VEALAPLVREAMERIDPLARVKSVAIETELEVDTLPRVPIDGDRIQQVLSNLLGNAVKHAGEGGHVRILGRVLDGEVEIAVEDDGPGIAPEDLEQVFDRFWRGGGGRGTGIGLGLSIARGIVEGHGGRIRADSVLGEGTVFRFTLPMER
jgi:signal transduction histidine kinase